MLRPIQIPKLSWLSFEIVFLPHNINQSKNACSAREREAAGTKAKEKCKRNKDSGSRPREKEKE
jgi:hypothetical protein